MIIFLTISMSSFNQEEWIRSYHENETALFRNITESYDNGYLLSGWLDTSFPNFNFLIKTDINGYTLWEKTIGSWEYVSTIHGINQNDEGAIFITGSTYKESSWGGDPYVMKLNVCGEKLWCNILHTPNNEDNAYQIIPTDDGGCHVALKDRGFETDPNYTGDNHICLGRFDDQGTKLWETCFNGPVSTSGEMPEDMTITPEGNLLFSGSIYSHDTATGLGWLKCYYIMSDPNGNFLWETIVHRDSLGYENSSGGHAWESVVSPNGEYIFSSVSHYVRNSEGEEDDRPAFVILDLEGNFKKIKDLVSGYQNGRLRSSRLINDSTATGSAGWGNDAWEDPTLAVKFDTAGNIIEQREVTGGIYLSRVEKTFDNKLLFYTQDDQGPVDHTVYLVKYNQNLEYDTLYNQPMEYDTLCPYPIASDTITLDGCMLSTSSEENTPEPKTYSPELKVYPNPARGPVTVELPGYIEKHSAQQGFQITQKDYQYHRDAVLHVTNIHGQQVATHKVKGQKKITLPTLDLSPGIYMVVMKVDGKRYAREKVIVRE